MNLFVKLFLKFISLFYITNLYADECIKIRQINVDDNEILDSMAKAKLFENYYGECLETAILKSIINTLSKYYIDRGYITTKPYLEEQSILDGQIEIWLLEW